MRRLNRLFSTLLVALSSAGLLLASGCDRSGGAKRSSTSETDSALCQPHWCASGCGDDGCGGTCACSNGTACSAANQCVATAECKDTCQSAGWQCGTLCGVSCGTCPSGQTCYWNRCYQAPVDVSCPDCALRLSLVSKEVSPTSGNLTKIVLAIDYTPSAQAPARMADLRVYANAEVDLVKAEAGPALSDAQKILFPDPATHRTWKKRADRSFQMLALSLANTNPVAAGRVATLEFSLDTPGPVPFKLVRHETLAPTPADNALDSLPYDSAIVVTAQ
jgi:hypothetical protein